MTTSTRTSLAIITCLALATLAPGMVRGDECIDYDNYLHWRGTIAIPGPVHDMVPIAGHTLVAAGDSALHLIDTSDLAGLEIVARVETRSIACDTGDDGNHAFVIGSGADLQVIDISDPTAPLIVTDATMPGSPTDVTITGDYALVACTSEPDGSLQVVDISSPTAPTIIAAADLPGWSPVRVAIMDNLAYVIGAGNIGGILAVIDVSNPHSPTLAGDVSTTAIPTDVVVQGSHAYVANASFGLEIIDVSDPLAPSITSRVLCGAAHRLVVNDSHALVVGDGIAIIDITNPGSPVDLGDLEIEETGSICLDGDRAYIGRGSCQGSSCWGDFSALEVTDSPMPPRVDRFGMPGSANNVVVLGDLAYVASSPFGLSVADISDPRRPWTVSNIETPGFALEVAVAGDYAYVADDNAGVQIIDISMPFVPIIVGNFNPLGITHDVTVDDRYLYSASFWRTDSLHVIDISDPTSPLAIGAIEIPSCTRDLVVAGDYIHVSECGGLLLVDISDPTAPVVAGMAESHSLVWGSTILGNHALLAVGGSIWSGLEIFDIAIPSAPVHVSSLRTPRLATGVALAGDHVYLSHSTSPLQIIDVTDIARPMMIGTIPNASYEVTVAGDVVFLAAGTAGCLIYPAQCAEPGAVELATIEIVSSGELVKIAWETVVEHHHLGFHVWRTMVGNGHYRQLTTQLLQGNGVRDSHYAFDDASVETGRAYIYRLEAIDSRGDSQFFESAVVTVGQPLPRLLVLHRNRPNPFHQSTQFGFELPAAAHVSLKVYDVAGREVRTLVDAGLEAGTHGLSWDGRDDRGRRSAAGVYLYRLQSGTGTQSRRLLLLR